MFDEITTFSFPTKILFGCGAVRRLPACLEETGIHKPLIVTDPGVHATPVFAAVASALAEGGLPFEVFCGVHGNPIEEDVLAQQPAHHLEVWVAKLLPFRDDGQAALLACARQHL